MGKPTTYQNQVLDRTKVLHDPRTQTYGETNYLKKIQVFDRTNVLHGPWTQTYGKTNYLKKNPSFGQNQGIVWSSDSNLWGNQLLKEKFKFWTKPRYCMVLGLEPMGKSTTQT